MGSKFSIQAELILCVFFLAVTQLEDGWYYANFAESQFGDAM